MSPAAAKRENADSTALRDPSTSRTATNERCGNAATWLATRSAIESLMRGKCNDFLAHLLEDHATGFGLANQCLGDRLPQLPARRRGFLAKR